MQPVNDPGFDTPSHRTGVPDRLAPTADIVFRRLSADERIRAAWLEGSLARGEADDDSDVDLHVLVDGAFDGQEWLEDALPLVLSDRIPGLSETCIGVTAEWVHVDLTVHRRDAPSTTAARVMLFDRRGALTRRALSAPRTPSTQVELRDIRIFLYLLGDSVAAHRRGDVIALSRIVTTLRDHHLIPLLAAENGRHPGSATKRIGSRLTDAQRELLSDLTPIGLRADTLLQAQSEIVAEYLQRAKRLAAERQIVWPIELERAVDRVWQQRLSISLPAQADAPAKNRFA